MRKTVLLSISFCFGVSLLFAQPTGNYAVELGAFLKTVGSDYFQGLDNVKHYKDHNQIHRYYYDNLSTKEEANAKLAEAKSAGVNARIINLTERLEACKKKCNYAGPIDPTTIKAIFFDFDKSNLRDVSIRELNKLYQVLMENPEFLVELAGHTDSKGSNAYNQALSQRRADAAKNFLKNKGITVSKIKTSTFGEESPIAKNELNGGEDTPRGRQFNRRVEIRIFDADGNKINGIVLPIDVPDELLR